MTGKAGKSKSRAKRADKADARDEVSWALQEWQRPPGAQEAAKVAFVNEKMEVWSAYRRGTEALDFPGGKAEEEETPVENAVREVQEEVQLSTDPSYFLGLSDSDLGPSVRFHMALDDYPPVTVTLFVFFWPDNKELVLTAEGEREMTQPAWRKLDDVIENLETSRTPPREGRNYARALRKLLARND